MCRLRDPVPRFRSRLAGALFALLALAAGCDSSTSPVAPGDTILSLTANPQTIHLEGTSAITVTALHRSGGPARDGTEISFSTTLGRVEPATGRTDADGFARATLLADGRAGSALVRAVSGTVAAEATITIQDGRPEAGFSTRTDNLRAIFTDTSSGHPIRWNWHFGDGGSSRQQNPVHHYADAGTYVVQLTATNAFGSDTVSQFVTVQ